MKISIITVTYNAAKTVADTLQSVALQTYGDIEHIVIDGASTDSTVKIVSQYGGAISKFVSEPDNGIYDAMNKGLGLATGEIIGFLNADDVYASNEVLRCVASLFATSEVDAVFGDAVFVRSTRPTRPIRRYRSDRFRPDRIAWGLMPAHPALFLRREVYERFGVFRTDYRIAGDFELIARIFRDGTLKYRSVPEVWVHMKLGGISTGGWRNTVLLNQEVLRACRENHISTSLPKVLSKYPAKLLEFFCK